ncbi:hypothetical protein WH95_19525 [Kiloniella litopenaei]|uniref:Uncharacterized protein n=1 Tax=Kiloniella litopenaei TaxID=1549748 RepID=A0A0M2R007_9PROT|nr:plasmid replication protein RepC [Kiloniella litopenaei]KKJ75212.1 hypothetical protein WH95_19525 [Kiloniella litopenaei]
MEVTSNVGSRAYSPKAMELAKLCASFQGLPEGVSRFEILSLLEFIGHDFGFKQTHIRYLARAIKFSSEKDWVPESFHPPVVWQSVMSIAIEMNRDERTVRRIERELHNLGAILWKDSGNHKRYGARDERGYIQYAYGVDLSPLAPLYLELKAHADKIRAERELWNKEKRELAALKRAVRSKFYFAELSTDELDELSPPVASTSLTEIREQFEKIKLLELAVDQFIEENIETLDCEQNVGMSGQQDKNVRHKYTTTNTYSSLEDTCNLEDNSKMSGETPQDAGNQFATAHTSNGLPKKPVVKFTTCKSKNSSEVEKFSTGIEHLKLMQLVNAASDEFKDHIPLHDRPLEPSDIVDAAGAMCHELGINRHAWVEAITVMGRLSAAACVLIADKNQYHPDNPVRNPGGFLRGMVDKARKGELKIHRSIFGILERRDFDA